MSHHIPSYIDSQQENYNFQSNYGISNKAQPLKMQDYQRKVGKDIKNLDLNSQYGQKRTHSRNSSSILFNRQTFLHNNQNNNNNDQQKQQQTQQMPQQQQFQNNQSMNQENLQINLNQYKVPQNQQNNFQQQKQQLLTNNYISNHSNNNNNTSNLIKQSINNYSSINSNIINVEQGKLNNYPSYRQSTTQDSLDFQNQTNNSNNNNNNNNNINNINNNKQNLSYASNNNNYSKQFNNSHLTTNNSILNYNSQNNNNNTNNNNIQSRYLTNTTQYSDISLEQNSNKENSPPAKKIVNQIEIVEGLEEIADFLPEIIVHLRNSETKSIPDCNFMSNMQTDINEKMRGILLDWLIDVHLKFKLLPETLFITVNVIDRYLSLVDIHRTKLQLVGVAALFIACKYEEVYSVPHIKDLVYVCDKAYTKEEILSMEGQIIEKLDFNLISVSPLRFLDYYTKQIKMDEKNYMLCRYLIEMTLIELKMAKYKPSMIACASIYLVHKIRKNSQPWNEAQMQKNTLYCEQEIRPCAKDLCTLLQTIDKRSTFKSLQRKFSLSQYCEVAKIRIERKQPQQNQQQSQQTQNQNQQQEISTSNKIQTINNNNMQIESPQQVQKQQSFMNQQKISQQFPMNVSQRSNSYNNNSNYLRQSQQQQQQQQF